MDVEGKLPDSKMSVDVHGSGKPHALVELNAGQMDVKVQVTSANGSVVTCYTVNFRRDHWGFVPNEVPREYECPICSNVIHCAAYSKVSGKHRYCHACIVEMTRTRNVDFVSQQHLGSERIQLDEAHDKQIAELKIRCPCCTRSLPLSKMNAHLATCDNKTVRNITEMYAHSRHFGFVMLRLYSALMPCGMQCSTLNTNSCNSVPAIELFQGWGAEPASGAHPEVAGNRSHVKMH